MLIRGLYISLLCLAGFAFYSCDYKRNKDETVSTTATQADYELTEDKSKLAGYYNMEHLKEWYPERIQAPAFNYSMNLGNKTIVELSLLRNEIFARNGYLFDDAVLRGHFNQFKWYQPVFDIPEFKVQLNKEEAAFVERVLKRESELAGGRYIQEGEYKIVSWDHVYNTMQFKEIHANLKSLLAKNNFAIVRADHEQLFHVYDNNDYQYIPNFITTDLYLQVLHKHFSSNLQRIEESKFIPLMNELLSDLQQRSKTFEQKASNDTLKNAARWADTYLNIAHDLITGKTDNSPGDAVYRLEMANILNAQGLGSEFLDDKLIQYSQFKPRGNYTKSKELENYFRSIKWLNTAPIHTEKDERLLSALLIASFIKQSPAALQAFEQFNEGLKFIVGEEDNLSIATLISVLSTNEANNPEMLHNAGTLERIRKEFARRNTNKIRPQGANATTKDLLERPAILFTAGRYTFDAEILGRLVNVSDPEPKRPFPSGLDVFAAFGNTEAKNILLKTIQEQRRWAEYPDSLAVVTKKFSRYNDWTKNIYTKTFDAIRSLDDQNANAPLFMKTPAWNKKELNTALAAWTELKHDMLLYAEEPYAAEAGEGGGPPPPVHISYVEPNTSFWKKALELLQLQEQTLTKLALLDEDTRRNIEELTQIGSLLLDISNKELAHETITREEFDKLSWLGGQIEYLTFRIFGSDHLPEKERFVALVADVYRYNGLYLEEAVGKVNEIYVVAEINGKPYITKGAVFSYHEFVNQSPLSDEEWINILTKDKTEAPIWMRDIITTSGSLESKPSYSF